MADDPTEDAQLPQEVVRAFAVIQAHFAQLHPDMDVGVEISLRPKPVAEPALQIHALSFNQIRSSAGVRLPLDPRFGRNK